MHSHAPTHYTHSHLLLMYIFVYASVSRIPKHRVCVCVAFSLTISISHNARTSARVPREYSLQTRSRPRACCTIFFIKSQRHTPMSQCRFYTSAHAVVVVVHRFYWQKMEVALADKGENSCSWNDKHTRTHTCATVYAHHFI